MRKKGGVLIALAAVLPLGLMAGCATASFKSSDLSESGYEDSSSSAAPAEATNHDGETDGDVYALGWGSFVLIDDWDRYDPMSTDSKSFFVSENYDGVGVPDNISVEYGTSKYPKDEAAAFDEEIVAQLAQQTNGLLTEGIAAAGFYSDKGELTFVVSFALADRQITQYYIFRDYEYTLIYKTNFSGSPECDEAAETMMNTFEWIDRD